MFYILKEHLVIWSESSQKEKNVGNSQNSLQDSHILLLLLWSIKKKKSTQYIKTETECRQKHTVENSLSGVCAAVTAYKNKSRWTLSWRKVRMTFDSQAAEADKEIGQSASAEWAGIVVEGASAERSRNGSARNVKLKPVKMSADRRESEMIVA